MSKDDYKFILSNQDYFQRKEQEVNIKKNSDFLKSISAFKNDYIISTIIRTYPKDLDVTHRDDKIFYIFIKDTTLIKVTKDENDIEEPIQVIDIKDNSTCGGGFFIHMFNKIDIETTMKQIDLDLGEESE